MDKRWILILIIIIIAIICGYAVVSSSNTVGNAIIDIHKSTAVLPPEFSVTDSGSYSTELTKREGVEKIYIEDLGKTDVAGKSFNDKVKELSHEDDIKILQNSTNTTNKYKYYVVYYQNSSNPHSGYLSTSYLYSHSHTFIFKCSKFHSIDEINENLKLLVTTIKPDYKKSQE